MAKEPTVSITLTKAELWELKCNFSMSYESGHPDNKLADKVSEKLETAYRKLL